MTSYMLQHNEMRHTPKRVILRELILQDGAYMIQVRGSYDFSTNLFSVPVFFPLSSDRLDGIVCISRSIVTLFCAFF